MKIKKYWTIIKITWQRALTYRSVVLAYRVGEMAEIVVLILMWSAVFRYQAIIGGYSLPEMITYVLFGNLIHVMVRNWLADVVARDIKDGGLSLYLLKPINYLNYMLFREIGRISLAFLMSVISQVVVILFFLNKFIFNFDPGHLAVIALMVVLAFATELLLSFLVGLIAFWTLEIDGIYSTIRRLREFFAGSYFPLSLLPQSFVTLSFSLPFAYSFFVPTQLYLKKISILTGLKGIGVQVVWIILLYLIIQVVWRRGLKRYEAVGI